MKDEQESGKAWQMKRIVLYYRMIHYLYDIKRSDPNNKMVCDILAEFEDLEIKYLQGFQG